MYKFAKTSALIPWGRDETIRLHVDSVWRATDPFVVAHPDMFADAPSIVETSSGAIYRGVEQATAAPGEKRNSR